MALDVFQLRNEVVNDYAAYVQGFLNIRDARIGQAVQEALASEPLTGKVRLKV